MYWRVSQRPSTLVAVRNQPPVLPGRMIGLEFRQRYLGLDRACQIVKYAPEWRLLAGASQFRSSTPGRL